ncbi:cytochrome P450 306a1-like [Homarus americanus]|uniref:cytochrome P450 306a1-like n=1 Tax=Homarus americanus TaxID=6706 RepID=UPI001C4604E7|nr:cytochrome P450 306a1-like [Homarus americanus]
MYGSEKMTWLTSWVPERIAVVPDSDVGKLLTTMLATLLFCVYVLWVWRSSRNLPPGPWGLPLVGYLPWLNQRAPHLTMVNLVKRYGRVFSLKMGSVLVVVMTDPQTIRDILSQKSSTGRAPLYLTHGIMKGYGKSA